jgi:hypothetical protein
MALDDPAGAVHNEAAFRYLLGIERRRCARTGGALLLLTADLGGGAATGTAIPGAVARAVLGRLGWSVRAGDLVGWYRQDRVAGVGVTDVPPELHADVGRLLARRVEAVLRDGVSPAVAGRVRVRIHRFPEPAAGEPDGVHIRGAR